MIYLASPYSHPDPFVREERYQEVRLAKAMPTNRNLGFLMQLWAVGIGMQ